MGTNYYLRHKSNYDEKEPSPWGPCTIDSKYACRLKNGYVWNNTYYPTIEDLNKDYYVVYHIGKQSCGWRFLMYMYPEIGINSLADWMPLLKCGEIVDEYGQIVSFEVFKEMIEGGTSGCKRSDCKRDDCVDAIIFR